MAQRQLGEATGPNPSYLSKVENGQLASTSSRKTQIEIADVVCLGDCRIWLLTEFGRPPEGMIEPIAEHAERFRWLGRMEGNELDAASQLYPLLGQFPAKKAVEDAEKFDVTTFD